jgi:DNA-binding MarR family transcriptional regulator
MATMPTPESELTERQRDVLRLHREGKNPTEIGRELDISSQGVHGHLRRLRGHGLIESEARPAAAKRRDARQAFDPASTIAAVQQAIAAQRAQLDSREAEIDGQIEQLRAEKRAIGEARKELDKLTPKPPTA